MKLQVLWARIGFLFMLALSVVGCFGSFPGWIAGLDSGQPGCVVGAPGGDPTESPVVLAAAWEGSPCAQAGLLGAEVLAVDGDAVRATAPHRPILLRGEPSSSHTWRVRENGVERDVTLMYEHGPLANYLEKSGDRRSDLLVAGINVLGALGRTATLLIAAVLFARLAHHGPLLLLIAGAHCMVGVGLGFDNLRAAPWYDLVADLQRVLVLVAGSVVVASAPGVRLRAPWVLWTGLAVAGLLLIALALSPDLGPQAASLPDLVYLLSAFAGASLLWYRNRSLYGVERRRLRHILVAAGVVAVCMLPGLLPFVPAAAAEFHESLVLPVALALLPFSLLNSVNGTVPWDMPEVVRKLMLIGGHLLLVSVNTLVLAEVVPIALPYVPDSLRSTAESDLSGLGLLILAALLSAPLHPVLRGLVDLALFPSRRTLDLAVGDLGDVVDDSATPDDVAWSVSHAARAAFEASQAGVAIFRGEVLAPLGDFPLSTLPVDVIEAARRGASSYVGEWGIEPLRYRETLVGVLLIRAPDDHGFTPRQQDVVRQMAKMTSPAAWRVSRPMVLASD